ncbi:MAG: hypothetical protein IPF99_21530 [Deltaproteobacteria bacterium]|nr:hypothetical protein [Deltaproteobacteria bacterium]
MSAAMMSSTEVRVVGAGVVRQLRRISRLAMICVSGPFASAPSITLRQRSMIFSMSGARLSTMLPGTRSSLSATA